MKSAVVRQAWREKIALLSIAAVLWGFVAFYTLFMRPIMCPPSDANQGSNQIAFDSSEGTVPLVWDVDRSCYVGNTGMAIQYLDCTGPPNRTKLL